LENSVVVKLVHVYNDWPDTDLDSKTFTKCFDGTDSWSDGEWTDVPGGTNTLHFVTSKVAQGNSCCLLWVAEVKQDTSKADS
jgi:hypothetical protein